MSRIRPDSSRDGLVFLEAAATTVVDRAISGLLRLECDNESLHLPELAVRQIARLVHAEFDSSALVGGIEPVDGVLVLEPDLHAVVHLLDGAVALAECSDVVVEFLIAADACPSHSSRGEQRK